jgi:hypothetical protein
MRVRHYPTVDSKMARYWREADQFEVYDSQGQLVLTLTGSQLMQWIAAQAAQAKVVIDLARAIEGHRDLYPRRRLLGQHKPLKGR